MKKFDMCSFGLLVALMAGDATASPKNAVSGLPQAHSHMSVYTLQQAAGFGYIGIVNAQEASRTLVYAYEVFRYADERSARGVRKRTGVGIQVVLEVKSLKAGVEIGCTLPVVAAHAQLNEASVMAHVQVYGLSGKKIDTAMPGPGSLDVESYSKWISSVEELKKLMWDEDTVWTVVDLPIPANELDADDKGDVVASAFALTRIACGYSLTEAIKVLPDTATTDQVKALKETYRTFASITDDAPNARPADDVQKSAHEKVKDFVKDTKIFSCGN
jgi:hypothetical protein